MKTKDVIEALELLGQVYTGKDKSKPAASILAVIAFINKNEQETIEDIVAAVKSKPIRNNSQPRVPSLLAEQHITKLNQPNLTEAAFESIMKDVSKLMKAPAIQVAKGYSPKSKIDTKQKALAAIREEYLRRAREQDKASQDKHSLLM